MTDTQLILSHLTNLDTKIHKMHEDMVSMETRLLDHVSNVETRLLNHISSVETKLTADMDMREYGLHQEIDQVYQIALENRENILLLLPYKDKIVHANAEISKVSSWEERQTVLEQTVQSHSSAIRELQAVLTS